MEIKDLKPVMQSIEKTDRQLSNQGYTFNEVGISFNEAGVTFGGIYGNDGQAPK